MPESTPLGPSSYGVEPLQRASNDTVTTTRWVREETIIHEDEAIERSPIQPSVSPTGTPRSLRRYALPRNRDAPLGSFENPYPSGTPLPPLQHPPPIPCNAAPPGPSTREPPNRPPRSPPADAGSSPRRRSLTERLGDAISLQMADLSIEPGLFVRRRATQRQGTVPLDLAPIEPAERISTVESAFPTAEELSFVPQQPRSARRLSDTIIPMPTLTPLPMCCMCHRRPGEVSAEAGAFCSHCWIVSRQWTNSPLTSSRSNTWAVSPMVIRETAENTRRNRRVSFSLPQPPSSAPPQLEAREASRAICVLCEQRQGAIISDAGVFCQACWVEATNTEREARLAREAGTSQGSAWSTPRTMHEENVARNPVNPAMMVPSNPTFEGMRHPSGIFSSRLCEVCERNGATHVWGDLVLCRPCLAQLAP